LALQATLKPLKKYRCIFVMFAVSSSMEAPTMPKMTQFATHFATKICMRLDCITIQTVQTEKRLFVDDDLLLVIVKGL
jgi:hypothetical protein